MISCCGRREPKIIHAIKNENWVQVLNLLNHGADPNAKDHRGRSAIEIAIKVDDAMKIYVLCSRRAEIPQKFKDHAALKFWDCYYR